jgi:hypothetical protein
VIEIPALPPARAADVTGHAELLPRYEDIAQDGRLVLTAMMPGLGAAVWRTMMSAVPALEAFREQGILPILRRLVILGEAGPLSVHVPVRYQGTFRFAREKGGDRLFLNMWLEARAPRATTFGPPPDRDAEHVLVGRAFAEHVVTRPFAPASERKVTRLDAPGVPAIPDDEHVFEPAESLVASAPLEAAGDLAFGVMHTDSNQHVNSLVYPRVFEERVAGRLDDDRRKRLLARAVEMRWRKPFFAGERARVALALEGDVARGVFVPADGTHDRPSCAIAMRFA